MELEVRTAMRIDRILCLGAALVIPQLALAKLPFTNDALGKVEGTLDFCAQADPPAAPKYKEQKKGLVKGVSEKEVTEARRTQEYKDAYDWMAAELAKVPKDRTVQACTAYLGGPR
jgi:hypothetical protein